MERFYDFLRKNNFPNRKELILHKADMNVNVKLWHVKAKNYFLVDFSQVFSFTVLFISLKESITLRWTVYHLKLYSFVFHLIFKNGEKGNDSKRNQRLNLGLWIWRFCLKKFLNKVPLQSIEIAWIWKIGLSICWAIVWPLRRIGVWRFLIK